MNRYALTRNLVACGALALTLGASQVAASPVAAVLPTSRSVQVDVTATVFATIINPDDVTATNCAIEPASVQDADFFYQTTDPVTNTLTGTANTAVDIPAGGSQSFLIGMTPRSEFASTNVEFAFFCGNTGASPVLEAINTLLLTASSEPTPDVVAVAVTPSGDGIANIPRDQQLGFLSVATTNVGSAARITAQPRDIAGLDGTVLICETHPATGECLAAPAANVTDIQGSADTRTFSIFVSSDTRVPLDPTLRRIALEFVDEAGVVRGRTGVAVQGGGPSAFSHFRDSVADQVIQNTCVACHTAGAEAANTPLVFVVDTTPGYQQMNLDVVSAYLDAAAEHSTVLVERATGSGGHPQALEPNSEGVAALVEAAFLILNDQAH